MNQILRIYRTLLKTYGPQGWWPLINDNTLLCEYHPGDYSYPKTEAQRFEVCVGAILAQNTSWYPGVVRALQQLKLGRCFTTKELEAVQQVEMRQKSILGKDQTISIPKILTQNTAWPNVEKALLNLEGIHCLEPKNILSEDKKKLLSAIKPAGYYNQKLKKILIFTKFFVKLNRRTPKREELLELWGIGPETADSILLYAYKIPTFVVDAYTKRIFTNLGMIKKNSSYDKIKNLFEKNLNPELVLYQEFHALLVEHAKRHYSKKPYGSKDPLKRIR
jgi:endonuclease-3 related protein